MQIWVNEKERQNLENILLEDYSKHSNKEKNKNKAKEDNLAKVKGF